ncbi:MAG: ion transporter [Pleomorphochaeta sp.]
MNQAFLNSVYDVLENSDNKLNSYYNGFMLIVIFLSLLSLIFKTNYFILTYIDYFTVSIFILDYFLRMAASNIKYKKGFQSFIIYPFSGWAIIDLLSILPSFNILSHSFKVFRVMRVTKLLRGIRILKILRISKDVKLLVNVLKKEQNALISFGILTLGYIFITALIIFNVEPYTFNNFFDAIYWATVSLTTVGYGDIYATSVIGKVITMISSLFGIALIAMPASIITTGLLKEIGINQSK